MALTTQLGAQVNDNACDLAQLDAARHDRHCARRQSPKPQLSVTRSRRHLEVALVDGSASLTSRKGVFYAAVSDSTKPTTSWLQDAGASHAARNSSREANSVELSTASSTSSRRHAAISPGTAFSETK